MIRCIGSTQGKANLRVLEVKEIKTVPYAPLSHPFEERRIGTLRREHLDRILFWTTVDLEAKLTDSTGKPIVNYGQWALEFRVPVAGNSNTGSSPNTLVFCCRD
jgi:hypothetical protein